MRKKSPPELEFVSWEEFHELSFELAKKLANEQTEFDTLVSISRGGHVVSRILSDFLKLPIFNVSIASYKDLRQDRVKLTQGLGKYFSGDKVLLVDEIVDSGKTLGRATRYLKRLGVSEIYSVALLVKPHAELKPDLFSRETSKWAVFPYEVRETIESLLPYWDRAGWTEEQIIDNLAAGGFDKSQVEWVLAAFKNAKNSA